MKRYALTCLPVICAAMAPLSADVARTNQQASKEMKYRSANFNEITPPAPALAKHSADPFLTAEYIYWRASEEGLEYGVSGITQNSTDTAFSVTDKGQVKRPDFDYNSGFKVGFGLKFRHDSWDLYANYTWLNIDSDKRTSEEKSGQSLREAWNIAEAEFTYQLEALQIKNSWRMNFSALDLELGRNFFVSPRLTLRPHFGLKFGWIEQKVHNKWKNTIATDPTTHVRTNRFDTGVYKLNQDKFGVGIRAGLNTAWYMWNKWAIYANVAAAALYSDFDGHQKLQKQSPEFLGAKTNVMNFKNNLNTVTPVLELGLGLRFETNFCNDNYQFLLQVGWEEQVWFNENQFFDIDSNRTGNLTLEGLTVKAGFSF